MKSVGTNRKMKLNKVVYRTPRFDKDDGQAGAISLSRD